MQLFIVFLLVVIGVVITRKPKNENESRVRNSVRDFKSCIKIADTPELRTFSVWKHNITENARKTTNIADWVEQELETAYAKRKEQLNNYYKAATA